MAVGGPAGIAEIAVAFDDRPDVAGRRGDRTDRGDGNRGPAIGEAGAEDQPAVVG